MTAPTPPGRVPLISGIVAIAAGIVIGVVAVFTAASVLGQEPAAQASTSEVLEYGTR
jgi:Protein of unknown function (DUF2613)